MHNWNFPVIVSPNIFWVQAGYPTHASLLVQPLFSWLFFCQLVPPLCLKCCPSSSSCLPASLAASGGARCQKPWPQPHHQNQPRHAGVEAVECLAGSWDHQRQRAATPGRVSGQPGDLFLKERLFLLQRSCAHQSLLWHPDRWTTSAQGGSSFRPLKVSLSQPQCSSGRPSRPCTRCRWVSEYTRHVQPCHLYLSFQLPSVPSRNPLLATMAWWLVTKIWWSTWRATSRRTKCSWWSTSFSRCWTASSEERWRRRRPSLQKWDISHRCSQYQTITISWSSQHVCFSAR